MAEAMGINGSRCEGAAARPPPKGVLAPLGGMPLPALRGRFQAGFTCEPPGGRCRREEVVGIIAAGKGLPPAQAQRLYCVQAGALEQASPANRLAVVSALSRDLTDRHAPLMHLLDHEAFHHGEHKLGLLAAPVDQTIVRRSAQFASSAGWWWARGGVGLGSPTYGGYVGRPVSPPVGGGRGEVSGLAARRAEAA